MGFFTMELEDANKLIKRAWVTGIIIVVCNLILVVLALFGADFLGVKFDAWSLVDVVLFSLLTWGIYRKSRVCSVLMLAIFIIGKFQTGSC